MAIKKTIVAFILPLFICVVLLLIAVISIAIWFQKIRKKVEAGIGEVGKSREKVSKMTVKPRKKENKYFKSKRNNEDLEPKFYESPPMRDEHREILQMKSVQNQEDNESECDQLVQLAASRRVSIPSTSNTDSYIECIGGDHVNSRKTTSCQIEVVTPAPQKHKSQAATMLRTFKGDEIDSNANRTVNAQEGCGSGLASRSSDTVTQQQSSGNTNGEEMYEVMEDNSEVYENTGYVDDTSEEIYGNREVIDREKRKRSQRNTGQLPRFPSNWNSQATKYQEDDYEEEVYENQEIVEQERRKQNTYQVELYENYVEEDMYENC